MPETELRNLVKSLAFTVANLHYRLADDGNHFEYRMMIRTQNSDNLRQLSEALIHIPTVLEFRRSPTGD